MQKKTQNNKKLENAVNNVMGKKFSFCVGKLLILSRNLNFSYHCLQLEMVSEVYYVFSLYFFSVSLYRFKCQRSFFFGMKWSNLTQHSNKIKNNRPQLNLIGIIIRCCSKDYNK